QALREIFQSRHSQSEVPLGVRDRKLLACLLLAIFGDVFPLKGMAVPAPERAEEFDRSPPPRAPAVGIAVIGLRRRNVQDARKFALVLMLHRAWFRPPTHAPLDDANANRRSICSGHALNSRTARFGCAT